MRKSKRVTVSNPTKKHMGRTMAEIREAIRLSQEDSGALMGKSQQTVSRLEQQESFTEEEYDDVLKGLGGVSREFFERWEGNPRSLTINHVQDQAQGYVHNNYINPLEVLLKAKEENKNLYERLLAAEKEKVAMQQQVIELQKEAIATLQQTNQILQDLLGKTKE